MLTGDEAGALRLILPKPLEPIRRQHRTASISPSTTATHCPNGHSHSAADETVRASALVLRRCWRGIDQSWIDPGAAAVGEGGPARVLSPALVPRAVGPAYWTRRRRRLLRGTHGRVQARHLWCQSCPASRQSTCHSARSPLSSVSDLSAERRHLGLESAKAHVHGALQYDCHCLGCPAIFQGSQR
jgi:hypothetical protein